MKSIENIALYTGERFCADGRVLLDGEVIFFAGDAGECPAADVRERIDGRGALCMPALFNAHTHAAMTIVRGVGGDLPLTRWLAEVIPYESRMDREAIFWGTRMAMLEMIRRGTAGFADMYFFMDAAAEAVIGSGMKASLTRGCSDRAGVDDVVSLNRTYHGADGRRIRVPMGLHGEYTSDRETARYAVEWASRLDAGFHTHIAETQAEIDGCRKRNGVSPARYFANLGAFEQRVIAAHCVCLDPEDIALLRDARAYVAHCPASNLKLGSGVAPVPEMLREGVRVCLGTDGAASNNTLDLFADMRLAALLHKGVRGDAALLDARQAIRTASRHGARAMGFDDTGLLRSGMKADLVLLDVEHLIPGLSSPGDIVYGVQGLDVLMTMVDGRVLYERGAFQTLDERRIKSEFRRIAGKIRT